MRRVLFGLVAVALGAVVVFSSLACGDDDDDGESTPTSTPVAGSSPGSGGTTRTPPNASPEATSEAAIGGAVAILTAAAGGTTVPPATLEAAQTTVAGATAPPAGTPPPGDPGASATAAERSGGSVPVISLDTNIANGAGPCDIIDSTAEATQGSEFVVAACLEGVGAEPLNGELTSLEVQLQYGSQLTAPPGSGNGLTDLDSNPDLNQGPALGGDDWDCNVLDEAASAPKAAPSPARIVCSTADVQANQISGQTVALAVFRFTAQSSGTADLTLVGTTGVLARFAEVLCLDGTAECRGGSVDVR